ncbi:hypothetical protein C8Q76DRAFT_690728 [Earliella scabrosa]|nr:hypothetical protein C8Q76DRAFT_690728 [Earliella scabrosa]
MAHSSTSWNKLTMTLPVASQPFPLLLCSGKPASRWCSLKYVRQAGYDEYTTVLGQRREWFEETLPQRINTIVTGIQQCARDRKRLLDEGTALWEGNSTAWFNRPGTRLPAQDFADVVTRYMEILTTLGMQREKQQSLLADLKVTELYTTTLPPGDLNISLGDIRECFKQYELISYQAAQVTEFCSRLTERLRKHNFVLDNAHKQV